jgi:hypothetical protein
MGTICENKVCDIPLSIALLTHCSVKWNQMNGQMVIKTQFGLNKIGAMCPEVAV